MVRTIDVLNTADYVDYQNANATILGRSPMYVKKPNGNIYANNIGNLLIKPANWASDIYGMSVMRKNRISILGGTDLGNYYFSGGTLAYVNDLPKTTDFNLKVNQHLNKKIKIGVKLSGVYTKLPATIQGGVMSANTNLHSQIVLAPPIDNITENNQNIQDTDQILSGPMAWITEYEDLAHETRLLGRLQMDYKISSYLSYKLTVGGDYNVKERKIWFGTDLFIGKLNNGLSILNTFNRFRYNIDHLLTFKKIISKHHKVNSTLGYLIDQSHVQKSKYKASNFADKSLRSNGISFGQAFTNYKIGSENPAIRSVIARVQYSFLDKYLFTSSFRADGSSRFSKKNRWGYFPSLSFAWRAIKEPFLENQQVLSNLKIRFSYGEVGNQNINSYQNLTFLNKTSGGLATADGGNEIALIPQYLSNKKLTWESSNQYNFGVDYGWFQNRIKGSVDVYYKQSSNLLLNMAIASSTGFNCMTVNQGNLINKGIEFSVTADVFKKKHFGWTVFGNLSFNKNKIGDLGFNKSSFGALGEQVAFLGAQISRGTYFKQPANIYIQGKEAGLFYGFKTQGIISTKQQLDTTPNDGNVDNTPLKYRGQAMRLGDVYFVDQNGDGDITDADKTIIGNPNPDFIFGLGSNLTYKNFTLSIMLNGVYGNQIANGNTMEYGYANNTAKNVRSVAYHDAWDPVKNTRGNYPYVGVGSFGSDYTKEFNDRNIEDGSFLRLSYITMSYNFPIKKNTFIDNVKMFVAGQNLWLLTKYSGFDPEVDSFPYDATKTGVDWGSSPKQRTFTLGLNLMF